MHKPNAHMLPKEGGAELSVLLDKEFDEEALLEEPEGILFLLTDDPHHFNLT